MSCTVYKSRWSPTGRAHLDRDCEGLEKTAEIAEIELKSLRKLAKAELWPCRMCALEDVLAYVLSEPGDVLVSVCSQSRASINGSLEPTMTYWNRPTDSSRARIARVGAAVGWQSCETLAGTAIWGRTSPRGAKAADVLVRTAVLGGREPGALEIETYWALVVDSTVNDDQLMSSAEVWETTRLLLA